MAVCVEGNYRAQRNFFMLNILEYAYFEIRNILAYCQGCVLNTADTEIS